MKYILLILSFLVLTQANLKGQEKFCSGGRQHFLHYEMTLNTTQIYNIEQISDIATVTCDIDGSQMQLTFSDEEKASTYFQMFTKEGVVITGSNKTCPVKGHYMRIVHGGEQNANTLTLMTNKASYTQIFENANISYTSTPSSCSELNDSEDYDKQICIGWNTDESLGCKASKEQIPLYSNSFLQIVCDDCYVGLEADVFFTLEIGFFKLKKLQAGFRNSKINGGLDISLQATKDWSVGVDKQFTLVPQTTLISFTIAKVIPVSLWFEIPADVKADLQLDVTGHATAGVDVVYDIGDLYIQWDPSSHWTYVTPSPQLNFSPKASANIQYLANADLTLAPSLQLHVDQLFSYSVDLVPKVNLALSGDDTKICEDTTYDIQANGQANLDINIDWLFIHEDKTWGPTKLWEKSGQLSQQCFQFQKYKREPISFLSQ